MIGRRGFLLGLGALLAAPAIVKYEWIMPVRSLQLPVEPVRLRNPRAYGPGPSVWYDHRRQVLEVGRRVGDNYFKAEVPRSGLVEMGLGDASPSEIVKQIRSGEGRLATLLRDSQRIWPS